MRGGIYPNNCLFKNEYAICVIEFFSYFMDIYKSSLQRELYYNIPYILNGGGGDKVHSNILMVFIQKNVHVDKLANYIVMTLPFLSHP